MTTSPPVESAFLAATWPTDPNATVCPKIWPKLKKAPDRQDEGYSVCADQTGLRFGAVRTWVEYSVRPTKAIPPTRLPATVGSSFQMK